MTRSRTVPALVAVALLAVACSGSAPGRPDASATAPASPTTGSPAALPAPVPQGPVVWSECPDTAGDDGFSCADLPVPLDDADPDGDTVDLALTRLPAQDQARRLGSLVVNPGGPGVSAVDYLHAGWSLLPEPVRDRFDLVAFDPRGVGGSEQVRCATTAELDRYLAIDPLPDDPEGLQEVVAASEDLVAGCVRRSGRLLPHVSTAVAARDLERVRQAVGDERLTYLGYSYGTELGTAYLERYPERVRAMVLDGAVDPALTWDARLTAQALGFERALAGFAADCEQQGCPWREAVEGDLLAALDRLEQRLDDRPLPGDGTRTVGPGELFVALLASLYSRDFGWPALGAALADAEAGDGAGLLALSDAYLQRGPDGYGGMVEANLAINCLDIDWPRETEAYARLADRLRPRAPRFGPAIALGGLPCAAWPVEPGEHFEPSPGRATDAPPVVVVGTTRDPATPYAWSVALVEQLPAAVLVTYDGDGHTIYSVLAPDCIRNPVDRYLLTAEAPEPVRC